MTGTNYEQATLLKRDNGTRKWEEGNTGAENVKKKVMSRGGNEMQAQSGPTKLPLKLE